MRILIGYGLVILYVLLLFIIGKWISRRFPNNNSTFKEYLFAGKKVPFGFLAPSIFMSWLWVTTIIGSGEAGFRLGISGGISYSLGAGIAFALFIPILIRIKRMMPNSVTIFDFLGERFTPFIKDVYYAFVILIIVYIIVEQAAGIALVFNGLFHISFRKMTFVTVLICGAYVTWRGMRGVIFNELINFFIVSTGLIIFVFIIISKFDIDLLYSGLKQIETDPLNYNYNPQAINFLSKSGGIYALIAVAIGLGQIIIDPAYYMKANIAKDEKTVIRSFFVGGVIYWIPVAILSSFVIGYVNLYQNIDISNTVNLSIDLTTNVLSGSFGVGVEMLFAFLIFCIGCTSIIHCLIGIQSLFTLDFYKNKIDRFATETEKLKFGKIVVLLFTLLCAFISISLENISLLTIDTFSGIVFAAPCGAIIVGIFSKKIIKNSVWVSIMLGIVSGFVAWIKIANPDINFYFGIAFSFFVPIIFLAVISLLSNKDFNLIKLKFFE